MSLSQKISNKRVNAAKEGLKFLLSRDEIILLLAEARISEAEWRHDGFHLARINDTGDYEFANCRFIPATENYKEKKPRSNVRSLQAMRDGLANLPQEELELIRQKAILAAKLSKNNGGQNKLKDGEILQRLNLVRHLEAGFGWGTKAAAILKISSQHANRLLKRGLKLGFVPGCRP